MRDRADDVSCLHEQGAQRYANTYVDRQVGKPIKMLGPSVLIGQTFLGPTPSTEYVNTDKYIYVMTTLGGIGMVMYMTILMYLVLAE